MIKPNFFIVGMARAGTTSLWHYLRKHPDVFMSPFKEPNYFNKDIDFFDPTIDVEKELQKWAIHRANLKKEQRYRDIDNYLSLFKNANKKKVRGECSVSYLTSKTACEEIHRFNKNAKILVSLRNPIEAFFSQYHLYKNWGLYPGTFGDYMQLETLIDAYKSIPMNIVNYQNLFNHQNVQIILFEDFKHNTKVIYQQILDFLDVDRNILPDFHPHNSSRNIKMYNTVHILFDNRFLRMFRELFSHNELGISKRINHLLGGFDQHPSLNDKFRNQLTNKFETCIQQLQDITERDLSHWCNIYK